MTPPARTVVTLISTGGTIEKTYDQSEQVLANARSVLDEILDHLRLPDLEVRRVVLMNKDSLDMTDGDHNLIATAASTEAERSDGVVVVHGTDRLARSAEETLLLRPSAPVIFTGAMRPYTLRDTDAVQNVTEALLASRLCEPGVYVAMHNRVLAFPGVFKDHDQGTFVQRETQDS